MTGPAPAPQDSGLCRDCGAAAEAGWRCATCGSPRILAHPELHSLAIAHIDCDAFYASVEKRDRPELRDRPVIVGGGHRGVVLAACYVARMYGVRSAMPMFKALELCLEPAVIPPDMAKYRRVGHEVRELMRATTPLVQPLSIDEAFLDLGGTEQLHRASPARTLVLLARRIERQIGVTVSIGLSFNKFLAKVASDLDKPRGFAVIGRAEARSFLAPRPAALIPGVGPVLQRRLARDGILTIGQLQAVPDRVLAVRYGSTGAWLARLARGEDDRRVDPDAPTKSVSAETTFDEDLSAPDRLAAELWPLCESVARRLKREGQAGNRVTLKLKTADFRILTRSRQLAAPTQLAETLYQAALRLLAREADGRRFRLIGIGAAELCEATFGDPPDLFAAAPERQALVEQAIETVRAKLGANAIRKGRGLATGAENVVSNRERAAGPRPPAWRPR